MYTGHIQLITWLSSTALGDCAGLDLQNKLRQVFRTYAVFRCLSKLLDNLSSFVGQREFYQEKSWNAELVFLRKCVYTMGHCSERAEK